MSRVTDPEYTDHVADRNMKAFYDVLPPIRKGQTITLQGFGDMDGTEMEVVKVRKKRNYDIWTATLEERKKDQ